MRRLLLFGSTLLCTAFSFAALRHATSIAMGSLSQLQHEEIVASNEWVEARQQLSATKAFSRREKIERQQTGPLLDPELVDWLVAGDFSHISESMTAKLLAALEPIKDPNYVLLSKSTLSRLFVSYNTGTNMLGHWVIGLLGITPAEQLQLERAVSQTRAEIGRWALANIRKDSPQGDALVQYSILPSTDLARTLTNHLYSVMVNVVGAERARLLWRYEDAWFRRELGHFGAVTNVLRIYRNDSQPGLWCYVNGQCSPITEQNFPGMFRENFPGGWKDIATLEGFELPEADTPSE